MSNKLAKVSEVAGLAPVQSVAGRTGTVTLSVADLGDSELTALAGLTSAADALPYFTGAGTASTTTLTTFGRSLIDDTSATAARATLVLDQVDNTSDANKPVSTATTTALNNKLNLSGGTLTGALTLSADPVSALHAATKQYVDNMSAGLDAKGSVVAATTANITLSGAQTIDGISVIAGDRVLVKNQTTTSENGIYVVAAGLWTRATDADSWTELVSAFVFVETGTTNADTGWVCQANAGGTLGSSSITWTQFSGGATVTAGTGIAVSGNQVSLATIAANTILGNNTGSTAVPTALTATQAKGLLAIAVADVTGAAPLLSPTLTGTPLAPTASAGTNTTQIATTAFVQTAVTSSQEYITVSNSTGNSTITPAVATRTAFVQGTISGTASTRVIVADVANRIAGDTLHIRYLLPATASIVIETRNATTGGTLLDSITTDTSGDDAFVQLIYTGSAWILGQSLYPAGN